MAYRVDALMDEVQSTGFDPAMHRPIVEAKAAKLRHRHNAMLPSRDLSDQPIHPTAPPPMGRSATICVAHRPIGGRLGGR